MLDNNYNYFYNNLAIMGIAGNSRWTASTNKKVPMDAVIWRDEGRVTGAKYAGPKSLVTLEELHRLPGITNPNTTYHLNAGIDRICILDVEPKCPEDLRSKFLEMPYLYGELSASRVGLHLLFPLPAKYDDYPVLKTKSVMRDPHGYYEILLTHYVIFTRMSIGPPTGGGDFDKLFYEMAEKQMASVRNNIDVQALQPSNIQDEDMMLQHLANVTYKKEPSDFGGDMSRYEYGFVGNLHRALQQFMWESAVRYTDDEKAWLLYQVARDYLEHRAKHDTYRDGLPWLLYIAREVIATSW